MDQTKLDGISKWPIPKTTKDIQKFIGFCNYYCKFIHGYTNIAKFLNELLLKNKPFEWTTDAQKAFENLKTEFTKKPVLMTPDQSKPFEIECDASKYATGAILYQKDDNSYKHPINFYSKTLTPVERNYNIHDRELLAVVRAFEEWRHYLEGSLHKVLIKSDHQNLTYWRKPQKINR
jgi:hypothetical protein